MGRYGKTTFCYRYMLNAPGVACRFIFDDRGQAAQRLKIKPARTEKDCEAALASRWVCFDPHFMFPAAKLADGLRWFCDWSYRVSGRGKGEKVIYLDELWQWVDSRNAPPDEIQTIVRTGSFHGLQFLASTHSPVEFHRDIRRLVTEWVCFRMEEPGDLDAVRPYFAGVDAVTTLPRYHYIAYDRETKEQMAAQIP